METENLKQVVEKTLKMWRWLRDNPDKGKLDYPDKEVRTCACYCYLCEWFSGERWDQRSQCPLNEDITEEEDCFCCEGYEIWYDGCMYSDNEAKKEGAKKLVKKLEQWMAEHEKG